MSKALFSLEIFSLRICFNISYTSSESFTLAFFTRSSNSSITLNVISKPRSDCISRSSSSSYISSSIGFPVKTSFSFVKNPFLVFTSLSFRGFGFSAAYSSVCLLTSSLTASPRFFSNASAFLSSSISALFFFSLNRSLSAILYLLFCLRFF